MDYLSEWQEKPILAWATAQLWNAKFDKKTYVKTILCICYQFLFTQKKNSIKKEHIEKLNCVFSGVVKILW